MIMARNGWIVNFVAEAYKSMVSFKQPHNQRNCEATSGKKMSPRVAASNEKPVMKKTFKDLAGDFFNEEIICRLIHLWEARNHTRGNFLMGLELLLIDQKGITIQAFIPAARISRFQDSLKPNSVYRINKFMVSQSKKVYKVTDHKFQICFINQTILNEVTKGEPKIETQKFRLRPFADFAALVNTNSDLFDAIGQISIVTGDNMDNATSNAEAPKVAPGNLTDRVFLHLLMKEYETKRNNILNRSLLL